MKAKFVLVILVCILVIVMFSCSTGNDNDTSSSYYKIYKNFDKFPSRGLSKAISGETIVGVLLKYTSEGNYNNDVYPVDVNTFSIYCLFDNHGFNGDNMEFNYVLFVPEDIQNQYIAGNGSDPKSGNPFWWYMKTYMNSSMQVIQNDWNSTIEILCNGNEFPKANSEDTTGWK